MAEDRRNLAGVSADKLRLLMERLRAKDQATGSRIGRAPRDGSLLPLSFAQKRLWFLDRLAPGNAAYNIPVAARLSGPLDRAALRGAFAEVARRHEALRTTFSEADGVPRQEIGPPAEVPLPLVDLAALPAERREPEMLRLAGDEVRRPFDLTRGPLLRTVLYRTGEQEHTLLLNLHHIVADGWSLGVFLRELGTLYPSGAAGPPELPVQYADFAVWQRNRFQGEALERELAFWRERLAGVPPLELPADRPRPASASFRGGQRDLALDAGTARGLRELARGEEATLYMALLGLFQALLLRYTGQADLAVGSPVANRDHREIEGLIGLFINTVVLRVDVGGDPSVRELLRRVREVTLAAYAHAELPFEKLVEELEPERQPGRNPLFQVLLTLQNQPLPVMRIGGLDLLPFEVATDTAKLDLSVTWREEGEELRGAFEHSADLFEAATAERLRRHYTALLRSAVASPDRRLSELAFLSVEERRQLVTEWNGAPLPGATEETLDRLIAAQAARTPGNAALVREDGSAVTYEELDRLSDRLARRLRRLGVGPDVPVGVHLQRSAGLVIAMLGIWKAGGTHLPLDPSYPADRLAFMLEDSGAPLVITREHLAPSLPKTTAQAVILDGPEEETAGETPTAALPRGLAYILYTSGSTGRPKAVGVEHEAAVRHFRTIAASWEMTVEDRVLQIHSPSFDPWFEDTLAPLLCGGAVVICGPEVWEPARLLFRAAALGVTFLPLPTALWDQWVRESALGPHPEHHVRRVTVGGEAMSGEAARLWWRSPLARIRLSNGYGPTETVVTMRFHDVSREAAGRATATVEIGSPDPGRTAYVLDREGCLLPPGVPGELCLGGQILGRGYIGRPDLTAERYVPDPFAADWGGAPGGRMYRTGDLARRRPDGILEFLGRTDHQVKVRGFRIELGEIEAVLERHPAVSRAAVVAWKAPAGDTRLAAFVAGTDLDTAGLRLHLAASLPAFMVPSAFTFLESLPLTPNRKVDRKALERLAAAAGPGETAGGTRQPRTPAEEIVAGIWAELLGLPAVGAEDDFFDLGGHSLLAMRVVSRLRSTLGVELPLRAVFERPTVAGLAALAQERLRAAAPPVQPRLGGKDPCLSFAQTRLWFLDRLEPGNAAYNLPAALRVAGDLSIPAFAAALREIARRHEVLRTTFTEVAGEPSLVIHPGPGLPLPVVDLAGLPAGRREAEAAGIALAEARLPFDLERGPVARTALLRLASGDHLALFTLHHIVSDAWSAGVLARELQALYQAFTIGRPSPLPELPVQYASFAAWQREWLRGEALEALLAFWRSRLADPPAPLELPFDRPRRAGETFRGASEPLMLDDGIVTGIERLGRRHGATLFMTLLAAFETLLHRYTGRADFTLGTLVANRDRPETEGLIGFFVNTLVLRTDLAGNHAFSELLKRVRESALGAYAHQDLPFERLVEELVPERDLAQTPLFQVQFTLQGEALPDLDLGPGLSATLEETRAMTAKLDLSLNLASGREGWRGELKFNASLFDPSTVRRLAGHFQVLLAGIAAAPDAPVSGLPLLTVEERRQALEDWNQTGSALGGRPVHEVFEEHAARTPEAVALVFEESSLTFRELDGWANRLANRLRRQGIGPEARVGLCAEPSLALIAGLLGILKSGGAYVPLDPGLPAGRLAAMLEDSGARALVTQEELRDRFKDAGIPVVAMDGSLADESAAAPGRAAGPENLAYVIYTSGSTGLPKGVMVEHRQLAAYMAGALQRMALPPGSSFATVSTLAADLGNTSVFSALASGGTLHVISRERLLDPGSLAEVLAVDCLKIVPSHLAALLGEEGAAGVLPGRLLVTGGEAFPRTLAERVRELAPACQVLNHYGPTETTVGVLTFPTWSEEDRGEAILPLGRPLPGTRTYVVDQNLEPLPAGVPGELLVGGPQVSRGYLGRPDLTAEKFVPDPFSGDGGARLYHTGDLTRRRTDGAVEFLGRIDQQVKVRGYRVEPGEVEAVLAALSGVRAAAVLAHPDAAGGNRLVAYIVGAVPTDLDRRLPAHMVPSGFVLLPELPLTPNGKVDRRALARVAPEAAPAARDHVPPRTPHEKALARIWEEVLGIGRAGAHDDFFALGGHSLLGIRLLAKVEEIFEVRLPVRTLFQAPTLAEMAARIAEALPAPRQPIGRAPRDGALLPLSFSQERLWFLDLFAPGNPVYNVPSFVRLRGRLDRTALRRTLTEVTRRHESQRTTFGEREGVPFQTIHPPGELPLPLIDLAALPGREEEGLRLAREEARRPFDLSLGPLFRACLLRLADEDHVLLLNNHHIISDGWSRGVLIRETAILYDAFSAGRPSLLPEPPLQYADYAVWQRDRLRGEALEMDLAFWRRRLAGTPPLEMPADRPRPPQPSFRGGLLDLAMPDDIPGRLHALCRGEEATSYMALLAAFQVLLLRYSGQTDFAIGSPVAGRNRTELEGVIGFFVNTLALRVDLAGDPSFRELLRRVREVAVEAFSHEEMPFERIVEDLHPEREPGRNPVFQVMLALQNLTWPPLKMGGLEMSVIEAATLTAKVDLNLSWQEEGGRLLGVLEYSSDLFDAATAGRLARHAVTLLRSAAEAPDRRLSGLPLLSPEERRQLVTDWNGVPAEALGMEVLHERFAVAAAHAPEAVAVVCEGERLTYGELDRRANQIANHLVALGVVPGGLVGLRLERSLEMVAAILGVLKAGAAYVPLDPAYPAERLAFMVEDSGVSVVLTEESLADIAGNASDPRIPLSPEHPAYVIYTSGSTGRPKGVVVRHGNVARLFAATDPWFGFGPEDVWALFHSYAFDFSVWEIWGALLYGGRLVVVPYWVSRSPEAFYELVRDERVTVLNQTPSAFRQFIWAEKGGLALRSVIFGGEALEPASLAPWFARHGDEHPRLVNMYGITETTVHVTYREVRKGDALSAVGRPIPDLGVYLLDPFLDLVPIGVPGEIFVGGAGLALGYLNRPELTAERFVPNPFGERGSRLYRSGDLARRLSDGDLEYLGRLDHQLKVRGFRIELGEIEAALARHPAVREAVVVASKATDGDTRLSAFVVPAAEPVPEAAVLRAHVAASLPAFMAPSAFVSLESLPLTAHGKVDRKALERLAAEAAPAAQEYVPPRNPLEELLASLWAEVLGVDRVGAHDDFFALGGHSLLAVRLISKVDDLFGVRLPVRALFHATTLGGMAERIAEEMAAQAGEDFLQQLSAESEEYEESSHG